MKNLIKICFAFILIITLCSCSSKSQKQEDLFEQINTNKKFVVGISHTSKPFGFLNSLGQPDGFDIDLIKEITIRIFDKDVFVEFKEVTPDNRIMKLNGKEVDAVISTMTITNARKRVISFSNPYFLAGQAILVKKDSDIYYARDLTQKKVGIVFGTTAEENIKFVCSDAEIVGFKNYHDAFKELQNGNIDAMTTDDTILYGIILEHKNYRILKERFSHELYGIAFRKDSSSLKLKEHVNMALKSMENEHRIERLKRKWGLNIIR